MVKKIVTDGIKLDKITLFINGDILTIDSNDTKATAMAIYQDKILAVGIEPQVRKMIAQFILDSGPNADEHLIVVEEDLKGRCIVPGFIDAHMHPGFFIYKKTQLDLSDVRSYEELGQLLQQESKKRAPGETIVGFDLMEDIFTNPSERRFPNRNDLDTFCPNRPCLIMRHDGHICTLNSVALKLLGINKANVTEKTPELGEIRVDVNGRPTGVFTETATALAMESLALPDFKRLNQACKDSMRELASVGITTCGGVVQAGEEGVEGKTGALVIPLLESFIRADLIPIDFVFYITTHRPKILKRLKKAFHKLSKWPDEFDVAGIKIYGDGSFGASTACMFEPFSDSPIGAKGFMTIKRAELYRLVKETSDLGFQVICHAIGDKANRIVVDVFKEVIEEKPNLNSRWRIEHASILTEDTIKDAANLKIVMVCQPAFINSEYRWLEKRLGPKRIKHTYPFRTILDAGIMLAGASDAPIESVNVMQAIQACVTRQGFVPEQAITVAEALRMFTYNAAYALGQENSKGSLEPEKLANFLILSQNPLTAPIDKLADIQVLTTYHRGKLIYQKKMNKSQLTNK
ncbi:MAG: amidohydrolase [Candidatus Helarchaeota archaeon]